MSGILIALAAYALAVAILYGARWFEGEARRARGERARKENPSLHCDSCGGTGRLP